MVITMIRPEGVWQSADYRISKQGMILPDAHKQLLLVCPAVYGRWPIPGDPYAILSFTGPADIDNMPTIHWLRETVRGDPRPLKDTFKHLSDRLTRDVWASRRGEKLVVVAGVFIGKRRFYAEISNLADPAGREFKCRMERVREPFMRIRGSGKCWITDEDKGLLAAAARVRPAAWEDYLQLMADVNRRTAENDPNNSVSPWCQATYLGVQDHGAGSTRIFCKPDEDVIQAETLQVVAGIDLYGQGKLVMELVRRAGAGDTTPVPDSEEFHASVEGRP